MSTANWSFVDMQCLSALPDPDLIARILFMLPVCPGATHPNQLPCGLWLVASVCKGWRDVVRWLFHFREWREVHLEDTRALLRRGATDDVIEARLALYPQDANRVQSKGNHAFLSTCPPHIKQQLTMHMRVRVWWRAEEMWFDGLVLKQLVPRSGRWQNQCISTIQYDDDGEITRHCLDEVTHHILSLPIHEALWRMRSAKVLNALIARTHPVYWTHTDRRGVEHCHMHTALVNSAKALELNVPLALPKGKVCKSAKSLWASARFVASTNVRAWRHELVQSVSALELYLAELEE